MVSLFFFFSFVYKHMTVHHQIRRFTQRLYSRSRGTRIHLSLQHKCLMQTSQRITHSESASYNLLLQIMIRWEISLLFLSLVTIHVQFNMLELVRTFDNYMYYIVACQACIQYLDVIPLLLCAQLFGSSVCRRRSKWLRWGPHLTGTQQYLPWHGLVS